MSTVTEADIRRHFDALQRGDAPAVAELLADDFVQDWPQSGERIRGLEACLNVIRNYPGGVPQMEIRRVTGAGDHWVAETIANYPDGSTAHIAAILELRDGKVVHETDYFAAPFAAPAWRSQWVEVPAPAAT